MISQNSSLRREAINGVFVRSLLISACILLYCSTYSQQSDLQRCVLYRLSPDEYLYENEYIACTRIEGKRFMAITTPKESYSNELYVIFNGEKVGPITRVFYTNLWEEKGYAYVLKQDEKYVVNVRGEQFGPFDFADGYLNPSGQPAFTYRADNQNFNWDGGTTTLLPKGWVLRKGNRDRLNNEKVLSNAWWFWSGGEYVPDWFYHNERPVGLYQPYSDIQANSKGYVIHYDAEESRVEGQEKNLNINGKIYGVPNNCRRIKLTKEGNVYYLIPTDWSSESYSLYKNGELLSEYISHYDVSYEKEHLVCAKESMIYVDGKKMSYKLNAEKSIHAVSVNESGNWVVVEGSKERLPFGDRYVLNNGKKTIVSFDSLYEVGFRENGKLFLYYMKNNIDYVREGENITAIQNFHHTWIFNMPNTHYTEGVKHSFTSSYDMDHVLVDGMPYGNSAAMNYWYDEAEKIYHWTSLENDELILYSLPMND